MRCRNCRKEVSPKTSINISHLQSKDTVRLCERCFSEPVIGRNVIEQRFGSLMDAKPASAKNTTHYDIHGDNERARESRQRGIEKSRQVRGVG